MITSKHKKCKSKNTIGNDNFTAYAFLSPWIIGFIFFSGIPIIASFVISLTNWNMVGKPSFIGFENYKNMFSKGSLFWPSLKITLIFTIVTVIITMFWSLILALLLNMKIKFIGIFQFLYFLPAVMPSISLAYAFQLIYNNEAGILNYILRVCGFHNPPNWLNSTSLALPATMFVFLFTYSTGQMMLIFRSALKDVPSELYEASEIDGANSLQRFWYVTIPSISAIILFNMVMAAVSSLNNAFSIIYPLTNGGPNGATNVLCMLIYNNAFKNYRMGYASALAVMLFILAAILSGLQFLMSKKWVTYEN